MRDPLAPVVDERVVDLLEIRPPRGRLVHRQPQAVTRPPEVEAALRLEHHRQVSGQPRHRPDLDELTAERPDRQLRPELRRVGAGRDHEHVAHDVAGVDAFAQVDAERLRPRHQLTRDAERIGHPVLPAGDRAEDVVHVQPVDQARVDALDRHTEPPLQFHALLERRKPVRGRGQEQVADLLEERPSQLLEEADRLASQAYLGLCRELLAHTAHRLARRARSNPRLVREDDVVRTPQGELVGDARADRARAGYDDSSHRSSSDFSSGRSDRRGRLTSSRTGTPSRPRQNFAAAWNG